MRRPRTLGMREESETSLQVRAEVVRRADWHRAGLLPLRLNELLLSALGVGLRQASSGVAGLAGLARLGQGIFGCPGMREMSEELREPVSSARSACRWPKEGMGWDGAGISRDGGWDERAKGGCSGMRRVASAARRIGRRFLGKRRRQPLRKSAELAQATLEPGAGCWVRRVRWRCRR